MGELSAMACGLPVASTINGVPFGRTWLGLPVTTGRPPVKAVPGNTPSDGVATKLFFPV